MREYTFFGEIEKFYLFLGLSAIFTGPLRVFLGNMGVFCGKYMDRTGINVKLSPAAAVILNTTISLN